MIDELDLAILKTLISNRKNALEFAHECNEKLFDVNLWRFAKLIIDYIKTYKNIPTKRILTEKVKSFKNEAFLEHFNEIFSKVEVYNYNDLEYKHDLEKLKARYSGKLISNLKTTLVNQVGDVDIKKSTNEMQSVLSNIQSVNQAKTYSQGTLKELIPDFRNRYLAKLEDPTFGAGLMTGYSFFDFTTSGLRPGEMFLIAGESGGGKSMILMNIALNMWLQGNSVDMVRDFKEGCDILYFSLEMPLQDCEERILSRLSLVPQKSIRDAKLNDEEQQRLGKTTKFIANYPWDFEIVDVPRGASIQTIESIFEDISQRRRKPKVVVIDYLTLMDYKEQELDDWLKQGKISEQLHEFGRVHEIVMLSAVQLNDPQVGRKTGESQIGLHRIGRSRQIVMNANFAMQIEKRANEPQFPDMPLHLIKSRRTELIKGKVYKNFACCALLNDPFIEENRADPDDISARISNL